MRLYFIRHAQSENNAMWDQTGYDIGRSEDPVLTETGIRQAQVLAEFLAQDGHPSLNGQGSLPANLGIHITHLYSSLMERSVMTGTAVSNAIGIPLQGWLDLHETGGIYLWDDQKGERVGLPGKSPSFFRSRYPKFILPEEISASGWWNRPYEMDEELFPRARRVIDRILVQHGGTEDGVALVSHGGFFNIFMIALLGLDATTDIWFTMNNVGITRIDILPNRVKVVYTNRLDFLPPDLVT